MFFSDMRLKSAKRPCAELIAQGVEFLRGGEWERRREKTGVEIVEIVLDVGDAAEGVEAELGERTLRRAAGLDVGMTGGSER